MSANGGGFIPIPAREYSLCWLCGIPFRWPYGVPDTAWRGNYVDDHPHAFGFCDDCWNRHPDLRTALKWWIRGRNWPADTVKEFPCR